MVMVEFQQATYTVAESQNVSFHIVKHDRTTEDVRVFFNTSYGSAGIFGNVTSNLGCAQS